MLTIHVSLVRALSNRKDPNSVRGAGKWIKLVRTIEIATSFPLLSYFSTTCE